MAEPAPARWTKPRDAMAWAEAIEAEKRSKVEPAKPVLTYDRAADTAATTQIREALAALALVDDKTTVSGAVPAASAVVYRNATMEQASLTGSVGFTGTNVYGGDSRGSVTLATAQKYRGGYSARMARSSGTNSAGGYARGLIGVAPLQLGEGSTFACGMAFRLDAGFKAANRYVSIMRLDNYDVKPSGTDHLGLAIDGSQYNNGSSVGGMRLTREQVGVGNELTLGHPRTGAQILEQTWYFLEMLFTLSATAGVARNQVFVDGVSVLDNTTANLFSNYTPPWSYCRYGLAALNPGIQADALGMHVDNAYVTTGARLGVPA